MPTPAAAAAARRGAARAAGAHPPARAALSSQRRHSTPRKGASTKASERFAKQFVMDKFKTKFERGDFGQSPPKGMKEELPPGMYCDGTWKTLEEEDVENRFRNSMSKKQRTWEAFRAVQRSNASHTDAPMVAIVWQVMYFFAAAFVLCVILFTSWPERLWRGFWDRLKFFMAFVFGVRDIGFLTFGKGVKNAVDKDKDDRYWAMVERRMVEKELASRGEEEQLLGMGAVPAYQKDTVPGMYVAEFAQTQHAKVNAWTQEYADQRRDKWLEDPFPNTFPRDPGRPNQLTGAAAPQPARVAPPETTAQWNTGELYSSPAPAGKRVGEADVPSSPPPGPGAARFWDGQRWVHYANPAGDRPPPPPPGPGAAGRAAMYGAAGCAAAAAVCAVQRCFAVRPPS